MSPCSTAPWNAPRGSLSQDQRHRVRDAGTYDDAEEAVRRQDAAWAELRTHFPALPGERQLIVLDVDAVQTSCGYAVPTYTYVGERETLARWAEKKGPVGLLDYWREKNQVSIDGLPTGLLEDQA